MPSICPPTNVEKVMLFENTYSHLTNLCLADEQRSEQTFRGDEAFVSDETKGGNKGLVATKSRLGWLGAGSVFVPNDHESDVDSAGSAVLTMSSDEDCLDKLLENFCQSKQWVLSMRERKRLCNIS